MRHNTSGRKFGKTASHRMAMFKNMAASLIEHGRIKTTLHKAKDLRSIADRLVTWGKTDTVFSRRKVFDFIRNKNAVQKLFKEIAPSFENRQGGYTRIYQLGHRAGDAAKMAFIEFLHDDLLSAKVEGKVKEETAKDKKTKAKASSKKSEKKAVEKKAVDKKAPAKIKKTALKKPVVRKTQARGDK
ncbi:MAG: 50S ribosomal protein L17 [Deltaproteobacteria bacterium]|nr:50S ribosomal protein L17 [Deltaproteobacteria bacterium]